MKKCNKGTIGKPIFNREVEVGLYITPPGELEQKFFKGKIYIIDAYGTFEQSEEPSYDVLVENFVFKDSCLIKHIRESSLYILEGNDEN